MEHGLSGPPMQALWVICHCSTVWNVCLHVFLGVLHLVPCNGSVHACYEEAAFVIAASLKWVGAGGRNGSGRIGRQL